MTVRPVRRQPNESMVGALPVAAIDLLRCPISGLALEQRGAFLAATDGKHRYAVADTSASTNMYKMPNSRSFSNFGSIINNGGWVNLIIQLATLFRKGW